MIQALLIDSSERTTTTDSMVKSPTVLRQLSPMAKRDVSLFTFNSSKMRKTMGSADEPSAQQMSMKNAPVSKWLPR